MRTPEEATSLCHACPKLCRHSCPVAWAEKDEMTTPWGKMTAMKLADDGHLPFDEKTASLAYKCLNCHASEKVCELGNPVPETLNHYRAKAFATGVSPRSVYDYSRRFLDHNNPFGRDLSEELKRLYPKEIKGPQRRVGYFPSCIEIDSSPKSIGNTLKWLRSVDPKIGLTHESIPCCGYPLYLAGNLEGFREIAEVQQSGLRKYREVIVSSPACLYTMSKLYPKFGAKVSTRFVHVSQKLLPLLQASIRPLSRLRERAGVRAAYHDPCLLGRGLGIYEEPRKLITHVSGRPPLEFFQNRESSLCCGAGGLFPVTSPESARLITKERLEEFKRTGADRLVTGCPFCVSRFQEVAPKLRVMGLVDFLEEGAS